MGKILVTGGLGFIGSNLINLLLKKKFTVLNIDKVSYASNFYNTREFIKHKKLTLLHKFDWYIHKSLTRYIMVLEKN